ncbi:uncharacterized protein MONOS_17839 [Monocercomonoides exilis]|uniref:uncharacterized protein n=1 Tax=Monocercomonoides exilis TaxID=2049356 RepID=UPI0035596B5D|nr:hypothetical protein MONOS_17839 [Monocercomonoides exilis]
MKKELSRSSAPVIPPLKSPKGKEFLRKALNLRPRELGNKAEIISSELWQKKYGKTSEKMRKYTTSNILQYSTTILLMEPRFQKLLKEKDVNKAVSIYGIAMMIISVLLTLFVDVRLIILGLYGFATIFVQAIFGKTIEGYILQNHFHFRLESEILREQFSLLLYEMEWHQQMSRQISILM